MKTLSVFVSIALVGFALLACKGKPNNDRVSALDTRTPVSVPASNPAPTPTPQIQIQIPTATELLDTSYKYDQENVDTHCANEWTKRGTLNKMMFEFCKRTEKKAHANLVTLVEKYKDDHKWQWIDKSLPSIWNKWTKRGVTRYQMVHYELNLEVEALLDIQYEANEPTFDKDKMQSCANQYNTWQLVKYCYSRD